MTVAAPDSDAETFDRRELDEGAPFFLTVVQEGRRIAYFRNRILK